jgi:hypothetical protein
VVISKKGDFSPVYTDASVVYFVKTTFSLPGTWVNRLA